MLFYWNKEGICDQMSDRCWLAWVIVTLLLLEQWVALTFLLCICWIDSFWCRCSARCWCKHQILQLRARASRSNDAEVLGDLGWAQPLRGTAGVWSWLHLGYPVLFGPQCVLHQYRNQKCIISLDGCGGSRTNSISKNISIRFIMFITYFQMYAK